MYFISTDKDMEFTFEENGNRSFTESCVCRLDLWFPDLSIHWNHLGGFKPLRGLSLIPGDCSLIGLQDGLVHLWDPQVMLMCRRFRNHWVWGTGALRTHHTQWDPPHIVSPMLLCALHAANVRASGRFFNGFVSTFMLHETCGLIIGYFVGRERGRKMLTLRFPCSLKLEVHIELVKCLWVSCTEICPLILAAFAKCVLEDWH